MEQKNIMNSFDRLYNKMATSNEPRYMQVFGNTMKSMMKDMVDWKPDVAQEYLSKLEAVDWCNYLSRKEATAIVNSMNPKGGWGISEWEMLMNTQGYRMEDIPYYNKWALYVAMNMIYSDSAVSIAKIVGKTLTNMTNEEMLADVYMLALDKLKDKDGMFDIRSYFHV